MSVPNATYLFPSKSTNANSFLTTPTIVSVRSDCHPPIFSGSPYLNRVKSESTQRPTAPTEVSCRSIPGANLIVDRNGQPINTGTSNLTISTAGQSFSPVYVDSTRGWAYKTNTA